MVTFKPRFKIGHLRKFEMLWLQQGFLSLRQSFLMLLCLLRVNEIDLLLQLATSIIQLGILGLESLLLLIEARLEPIDPALCLNPQVGGLLEFLLFPHLACDWLQVQLEVKQESWDYRRHVIELISLVVEILVQEVLTDLLALPL